jgi:transient receptor potential cation channel subfamily M member 3
MTSQLLTYDLINWGHWTCLSLAVVGDLKHVLSHASCQLLISELWMGGMKIHKNVNFKVITAIFFPPAILAITFKSAKELEFMPKTQEEHENNIQEQSNVADIKQCIITTENESKPVTLGIRQLIDQINSQNSINAEKNKDDSTVKIINVQMHKKRLSISPSLFLDKSGENNNVKFVKKIYEFYNAPITKFYQYLFM